MDAAVTAAADLVGDQVRRHDLAEVAEVDRAGRAEARGADDRFAGARRSASAMTSSAYLETQSVSVLC